ncbi:PAS domain-containing sensor histidine kinase [Confluentibacter citreus]|uniref:PAS domain-containing sensor histidine kinase n=1 Tax=Confluentibacter citreus TaxID=2007307 RepID=UPI000C28F675|nr:PAS domain-containing sensor histidine kinase [Confluentibacter citreus]
MLTKKLKFYLPFKIAVIYFLVGSLYIIFSDKFLENTFTPETVTKFQSYKGLVFVFLTSFLLFILIKRNLKKIKASEHKYRLLADHSKDLIYLLNTDSKIVYSSPSAEDLLGYQSDDILGKNLCDFIHPDDLKKVENSFNDLLLKGASKNPVIYRVKNKTNEYIWFESLKQLITKNNKVVGLVSSCRDITERVVANEAIKNYQVSLQNLTSEILLVEEKQRKEIAANIHDHLSQSLVISKMKLQDLRENEFLKDYVSDIDFVNTHITDALENSRKITYDLCPPVLYQLGIIDTMYWFSDKIEDQYNIKVEFTTNIDNLKLDDNELISIYRSIQEIVMNSIKHANASLIHIDFKFVDEGLNISVSDDGVGFNVDEKVSDKVLSSGFGLFTLKERIHNLKGTVNIISKPTIKSGTIVEIFISL